ncbi:MAG: oligoendopeptidase F [Anaerolineae bacterium]
MSQVLPKRSEVRREYTWDAFSVFPSNEAWEEAVAEGKQQLKQIAGYKGRLKEGPAVLADYFDELAAVGTNIGKMYIYASLFHEADTADPDAAARHDRARSLFGQLQAAVAFAEPEMLAIGFDTLSSWLQGEPRLSIYEHYLDTLKRRQAHVRSAEVEEVLGQVLDAFRTAAATHGILADADLVFEPAQPSDTTREPLPVAQGTIAALIMDPDREVRRTAWESYADAYLAHKNSIASCLATGVKQNVFKARARRYNSALEAAVSQNNIPVEVFHNTVETFRKRLPIWHRYWCLRRKILGLEHLHVYDMRAPLTAASPKVPFEKAVEWVVAGMRPLGDEYVEIMKRGLLEERWVDVYPNQGKRSGAFSTGVQGTRPFILMNYNDDLTSMSTLAHELGHSMHSYFTFRSQPFVYADYTIFVAEVASNFNQALVRTRLLEEHDDPEFQIAVIEEAMGNFHRYFFIMPTLARFEFEIHKRVEQGKALTADNMIQLMADLFSEGFGEEVEMDRERVGITWAQFPNHLYSNFYVYQYTTGIAAAHALAADVFASENGAVDNYLSFLKAGSSLYPLDALKLAGVDMTSPEPLEKTFDILAQMVDRLEELALNQAGG